jgi:PAS domain S-box-containing protein
MRADGSSIWLGASFSVTHQMGTGDPCVLVVAHDITASKTTERALADIQADLRMLLDSAADGFCSIDRSGVITLCNAAFLRLTGHRREQDVVRQDFHRLLHHSRPDGSPYPRSDCPVLRAAETGRHAHVTDEVFQRADGTSFPVEYRARPIERDGRIEGAVCTFVDITERRQAEARQQVINHELVHRARNILTVVQAIVSQTLRNTEDSRDAAHVVGARLAALSRAHDVLMRSKWEAAPIGDVVKEGVGVHGRASPRIRMEGPRLDVGPRTATALTMTLHELCINAIKYGALSSRTGGVSLTWTLEGSGAEQRFLLRWREQGGPPVKAPSRIGFGSRIIGEYCEGELGGRTLLSFKPAGLEWTLDAPANAMSR